MAAFDAPQRIFSSDRPGQFRRVPRVAIRHSLANVLRGISSELANRLACDSVSRSPVRTPMWSEKCPSS